MSPTAQPTTAHPHAWPSLPAADSGARRQEIAHPPAAIEALIAGMRQPMVRRADSSTSSGTSSASVAITDQWCRPFDTASAGGRSCSLRRGHPRGVAEGGNGGDGREREHDDVQVLPAREECRSRRMESNQHRTHASDSGSDGNVPPCLSRNARHGKREGDNRRLLYPGDPSLRAAKLRQQTQRKDHAEDQAPARVQHLIARLVDVPRITIDQIDQAEVDRQRGQRDHQRNRLEPGRAS